MITPRHTRLHRAPDLRAFQQVLSSIAGQLDPTGARACAFLVPNRAAVGQLRHALEASVFSLAPPVHEDAALALPDLVTRKDWYQQLYARLRPDKRLLNDVGREVMMSAAAREMAEQAPPPFRLRAGLIPEIVRLYDALRRLQRTTADFERLLIEDLEADADSDRGAARLLMQTRFLASTFRAYEQHLIASASIDEHQLRQQLLTDPLRVPYTRVVIAIADSAASPEGLWPADFDLLTRLPLLTHIDVVATEQLLIAGFHERICRFLPGIEEEQIPAHPQRFVPSLLVPADRGSLYFKSRDREDELADVVCRMKNADNAWPPDRTAAVYKRPLPYLYLAQEVFESAGVSYQTSDALPLAAEPYAAALDLVFDLVLSNFGRASIIALLRSPFFSFAGQRIEARAIAALDRKLSDAGYLGGFEALCGLLDTWTATGSSPEPSGSPDAMAAPAARDVAHELALLLQSAPAAFHLETLEKFLKIHEPSTRVDDGNADMELRGRTAIYGTIESLRQAHVHIDDPAVAFGEVVGMIRRSIESHTFAVRTGTTGMHLVDAEAARFGSFDAVHLLGLVDADWPDRMPRNIFFPTFLLQRHLGWPSEADRLSAVRAAFRDLLSLPHRQLSLSTFSLEDDAVVGPSVFLEDVDAANLKVVASDERGHGHVFPFEAISEDAVVDVPMSRQAASWLALRRSRTDGSAPIFHGQAGSHQRQTYAVGALETYLDCPFKFFAKHVLRLDEESQDEGAIRPRLQGIFLHRVFEAFFEEWNRTGRSAITLDNLALAKEVLARVVEPLLANLSEADAALERDRLFGTAAAEGLADIVFRVEAEWGAGIVERLLEYRLEGMFDIRGDAGSRRVALTGIADRIDLLEDGTIRLIDYKSGRPPATKRMLQLPVYSVCASQQLEGRHGRRWLVGDGGYIAFKDPRRFVPLADRNGLDQVLQDAQTRLLDAIDRIEAGEFAPTPLEPFRCTFCGYSGVCRKDYVGDE